MNALATFSYKGSKITFSTESGLKINATQMAKPFMKQPKDWLRLQSAQEFIATLSAVRQICLTELVLKKQGGNGEQGTWMHEDVALEFARWLSPAFAIWCNDRIKELLTAPRQESEARPLPPPERKALSISNLTEIVDGKLVTTSRKLAKLLGRKHDSILDTINSNRHQRWFKYGNFIRRSYSDGQYVHGSEYLITRKGLAALASIMRSGAKDKIQEAYERAWNEPQTMIPGLIESTAPATEVTVPSRITERMWSESEIIGLIKTESRKMKEQLQDSIQKHHDEGDMFYGPGGEVRLGIPLFFECGVEDGIKRMFGHLTNAYLDAYYFNGSNQQHRRKLQEAGKLMRDILNHVK